MTITKNELLEAKGKASLTSEGRKVREYTERRLVCSDVELNVFQLGSALGYLLGDGYHIDDAALLLDFDIDRRLTIEPYCAWDVGLRWSTVAPPKKEDDDNPLNERVKRFWSTSEHTLYVYKDRNGDMIVNSAKQPFEGGVPITVKLPTMVYERNEASFSGAFATQWANSLNQYAYSGAEPKTLKLDISGEEAFQGDYVFWKVRYEMAYFPLGWQPLPLDAGLNQVVSGELTPCLDVHLQPVTSPVPLSGGVQIDIADLPEAAQFIEVDIFPLQRFQDLGLAEFL